ncbi:MAG TPA: uroporphyrinogen-III synthase [Sphingobium sp.]|uniref:uroporphyrinogen-III synthase n=1 Tax=unclassified Sphingobium TaxID=2611147 RepID=UPI0007F42CE7|nr:MULTISPECIES: uroporphyrinogen-III synthase [unclassified Sphingobium]OAN51931.1 uroporphyrinogen-III synthase [Sphingobium sp. TCM1]WIW88355.1 uroporphyrinogen-III synthase [Sphingobium sp. V4]HAF41280.1 uroporphyrinogen-III synthase [Sphingobium sp.]
MRRVLILRPEPAAGRTAARAATLGMDARVHPLFAPQPVDWTPPPIDNFDALLLTSANGARLAGAELARYRGLPAYAVGAATAQALYDAGFAAVNIGAGDGSAIAARIAADGHERVLHLAGTTVAPMASGTLRISRVAVYSMASLPPDPALPDDAVAGSILLVHSPRAGERLAAQLPEARRAALHLVAISPAALAACGPGWASAQAPARPQDDEMLALALRLCEGHAQ